MQRSCQAVFGLRWAWASLGQNQLSYQTNCFSTAAAYAHRSAGEVPAGHLQSDLSSVACNIGLGRRRDLTLRQDLCLYDGSQKVTLAEVLRGKKVILVGFPGGPVCTEKHIPGYIQAADSLKSQGVDKVVCVTVDAPEAVEQLRKLPTLQSIDKVQLLADKNGGFMRLLGVELGEPSAVGEPRCQRFAAIVEDGLMLKLKVEQHPADLKVSDADSMMKLWQCVYPDCCNQKC